MLLTSKLIICFIDGLTSGGSFNSIAYLLSGSAQINIGLWTWKVKCTQCGQAYIKNAKAILFLKLGGMGDSFFGQVQKILIFSLSTSP